MTRARDFADLAGSAAVSSIDAGGITGKNLVTNGAMQVAQRATSATAQHGSGYIVCDRWLHITTYEDNLRFTVTQEADGPSGFPKSLKLQTTTAESAVDSNEVYAVKQRIEGRNLQSLGFGTSAAKKFTVSFYVKSSVAATYGFSGYLYNSGTVFGQSYTINSADTWERKSITFDANTSGVILDDNSRQLQLNWFLMVGTDYTSGSNSGWETFATNKQAVGHTANAVGTTLNATWQITGVQMEVGDKATPFEHQSFADELTRCQRYYYKKNADNPYSMLGSGMNATTSSSRIHVDFPTDMRAVPSLGQSANSTWAVYSGTQSPAFSADATINNASTHSSTITTTHASSSLTVGQGSLLMANNDSSAYLEFISEL